MTGALAESLGRSGCLTVRAFPAGGDVPPDPNAVGIAFESKNDWLALIEAAADGTEPVSIVLVLGDRPEDECTIALARAATARAIAVALGSLPHDVPVAFWFVTRPSEAVLLQRNKPIPPPPCGLAKRLLRASAHRLSQRTPPSGGCPAQWQTRMRG